MKNITAVFTFALISFFYIDYIASSSFGIVFSLILFFIFVFVSLNNLTYGIILSLFYSIVTMEFPRDILDVYGLVGNDIYYNVINTVKIGPLTLLVYLFFINSALALYKMKAKIIVNKSFAVLFFTLFLIAIVSTFLNVLNDDIYYVGLIVTNIKWFIFIAMGYIQGVYVYRHNQVKTLLLWLYLLPIFFGLRNILFLLSDFLNQTPKLDLMNQAYLSLIILIYLIVKGNWGIYKNFFYRILLFVSLLNFSRAFLLIFAVSVLIAYFWKAHKKIYFNFSFVLNIFFIVGLLLIGLYISNERLFDFLLWKLNVFDAILSSSGEMSGSGKIRALELQNVWFVLSQNFHELFFGRGFFATYNFEAFPLNNIGIIDLKSYSSDQLNSNIYYSTHSFSSSMLLKYGLIGLSIYIFLPLYLSYVFYKKKQNLILILIPIILVYSYYWRIEFAFLIGILFGLIKTKEMHEI